MIIDTETHVLFRLWPQEYNPDKSRALHYTWHEHSGDLLVDEMDRAGVDRAFLISYDGEDIRWFLELNDSTVDDCIAGKKYAMSAIVKYPDRFHWFTTLKDPRRADTIEEVERDFRSGAAGIKVFPAYFPLDFNDVVFAPILDMCAREGRAVIVSFEDTKPPATPSLEAYFGQLHEIAAEYERLPIQVNHAGCADPLESEIDGICEVARARSNVVLSTALLALKWEDETEYPFPTYLRRLERLVEKVGTENLMWATDWPWLEHFMKYPQAVDAVRRHASFMTESEKRAFLGGNAERFVKGLVHW